MRIGLLSDTHNELYGLQTALKRFAQRGIETVLHAGDLTSVRTVNTMAEFDVWIARGNMDHDPALPQVTETLFGPGRFAQMHDIHLNGARIALTHGDSWQRLESLVQAQDYDYIIHGHTHAPNDEQVGPTRVINPGAVGRPRWHTPTCAILDLETGDLTWIEL